MAVKAEREKIATRLKDVDIEKSTLDEYKKTLRQENLDLGEKIDRLEYANKELTSKVKSLNEFLARKESECDDLIQENEKNRKSLKQCQFELEQVRDSSDSNHKVLCKDLEELRIQNEDLVELVRTKERMLEDQLNQISSLKG